MKKRLDPAFSKTTSSFTMTVPSLEKHLYAVLSGVMMTASFPPGSLQWLAWFALVPLFKASADESPSGAFRLGLIAGFAHYLTLIYWIVVVLGHYGGLNVLLSAGILGLFSLYLSLYPALFSALISSIRGSFFPVLLSAAIWVSLELIRAHFLTGFPWCLLGYSQYKNLLLIQIAELTGVYGISFLIVLCNGLIYSFFFNRSFSGKGSLKWEALIVVLVVLFVLSYGYLRLEGAKRVERTGRPLRSAIVQGNMDQSVKWDPAYQSKTIDIYDRLTEQASASGIELVVWPETAMPFFFQNKSEFSERVVRVARRKKVDLVFGSPAYERKNGSPRYFNRAYSLTPEGRTSGSYDKVHLVPFGEYVPLRNFLPFVRRLVPAAGDFAPGDKVEPLPLSNAPAGILICFEVIFPELARKQTAAGATLLINLTNDAWFGTTSAPHQHLSMAVFRAIENRRPLIRAANTGISAFISTTGEVISRGALFEEEVLVEKIQPIQGSQGFYTHHGDLFSFGLLFISLIMIFFILCYKKLFSKDQQRG